MILLDLNNHNTKIATSRITTSITSWFGFKIIATLLYNATAEFVSLKKEKNCVQIFVVRKIEKIFQIVQAPQQSVASSMQTTTTTLFEDVINEEKGKSGVLVNENNLHLLMTPKR